jgi:TonB family protein
MTRLTACLALAASVAACARAAPPAVSAPVAPTGLPPPAAAQLAGIPLLAVVNAGPDRLPAAPVVAVVDDDVRVDGMTVDHVRPILDAGRLQRVDGLFRALKSRRDAWKAAHAQDDAFPGVVAIVIDPAMPAMLVKSVFQTAAFAGFPNTCFVVSHDGAPACVMVDAQVPGMSARVPPEVIQSIVRAQFDAYRRCYKAGLARNASLQGRVVVRFVVDTQGHVAEARDEGSTLPDPDVVACIVKGFANLSFPKPVGGQVTVVYPIEFNPGD